jgi:MFS superfamily sulfate permease-like transporter
MPSALGSMFVEALPFLRGIAASIQKKLGEEHPGILPTTVVAYAMSSMLLGVTFLILAAFRCGRLIEFFPRTIMTGVVGNSSAATISCITNVFRRSGHFPMPPRSRDHASADVAASQL